MDTAPSPLDDDARQVVSGPEVMTDTSVYDVAVVGTGPAGLAAALSLAQQGLRVAAIGAAPRYAHRGPVRRLRHALREFEVVGRLPHGRRTHLRDPNRRRHGVAAARTRGHLHRQRGGPRPLGL